MELKVMNYYDYTQHQVTFATDPCGTFTKRSDILLCHRQTIRSCHSRFLHLGPDRKTMIPGIALISPNPSFISCLVGRMFGILVYI